jgi:hypothetical protein
MSETAKPLHTPRQRTYVLDDHLSKYSKFKALHEATFPDGVLAMFSTPEDMLDHLISTVRPGEHYTLITDAVVVPYSPGMIAQSACMFHKIVEAASSTFAACYVASCEGD